MTDGTRRLWSRALRLHRASANKICRTRVHGGVCLLHRDRLHARLVNTTQYTTFEHIAVFLHGSALRSLFVVVYRPGSVAASTTFFDEFADRLNHVTTFSSVVIMGDVNLHLDVPTDASTSNFSSLLAHIRSPAGRRYRRLRYNSNVRQRAAAGSVRPLHDTCHARPALCESPWFHVCHLSCMAVFQLQRLRARSSAIESRVFTAIRRQRACGGVRRHAHFTARRTRTLPSSASVHASVSRLVRC